MELNWSTFLLEIINFLVLLWILKRFLYRPISAVLEKRRQTITQNLNEAETHHTEALALEQQYNQRLDDWAVEKQQLKETLQQEIQNEKKQRLEQLQTELSSEREKASVIDQHHQAEQIKHFQQVAHQQAAHFASQLLSAVADEALESRLFDLLIKTFEQLDSDKKTSLLKACKTSTEEITVSSAYSLSAEHKQQLEAKLCSLRDDHTVKINYQQNPDLIAGFRIEIGAWSLRINLQDELSDYAELAKDITS